MKIYFTGSIRGGRNDADLYNLIIKLLSDYGEVLTEHIGLTNLTSNGENKPEDYIYNRDMEWLKESDVVIAEVTQPSLGVGYELGWAESNNKKIICLYREVEGKKLSSMIVGNKNFKKYKYENLSDLKEFLNIEFHHKDSEI